MNKKRSALALLLALAMMMGCVPAFAEEAAALTLMVYMTGSDLESLGGAATGDITEMLYSGVDTERVNIVFCAGGSKLWQNGFPNDAVSVYRMDRKRLRPLAKFGNVSMGAPETLSEFLNYAVENCPADRYALILWDHGGGPMNGVCFDELFTQNDGHDSLALSELHDALEASPFSSENPLEWIGFDACLMSSVETADTCAPYAKYMIASQETEPGSGWNYSFLGELDGTLGGDEVGARIVERYNQGGDVPGQMLTLACIDLSKVGDVETAMNGLFSNLDGRLNPEHFSDISNARRDAKSFGRASTGSEYDLVDLYSLSEQYGDVEPERVAAVQAAVDEAVVCASGNQENSHGLSVYYPYFNKEYFTGGWKELYGTWEFARQYYGFLMDYAGIWLGEQMADWSNMRATAQDAGAVSQEITLPLTEEQVANFAFAQVFILGKMPFLNWYYYKVDEIDDVTLDDAGVLHADYNYKALYAVDADGKPQCDAIPYRIVDGYYLIRSNLTDKTWQEYEDDWFSDRSLDFNEDASIEVRQVYLQCALNEAGDGLDVVGIIDMREGSDGMLAEGEGLYNGKQTLSPDMDGWNWVWFFHFPRELQRDADGGLQSFEDWPNPNGDSFVLEWEEIDNTRPWSLKFLEEQYTGRDLYAQYIVHDTQGNLTGSNLILVANPNLDQAVTEEQVLHESENFKLTLTGIDVARASFDDGLFLRMTLEDKRENAGPIDMSVDDVLLNRFRLDSSFTPTYGLDAEGNTTYVLNLPSDEMPSNLEERVEHIAFSLRVYEDGGDYDDIEIIPVDIDTDVDISAVHEYVAMGEVIAEARAGDVLYRLMGIREDGDCLRLSLQIENQSDEPVDESWQSGAMVDGCEWHKAVEGAWFELPANGWSLNEVRLYTTSPEVGSYDNPDDTPQYSYPEYWGTPEIHCIEFTDWNNEPVRFDLPEPFALSGMEGVEAGQPVPEALTLFESEEMSVTLTGFSMRGDTLRLVLDLANKADVTLGALLQSTSVNGTKVDPQLRDMDGWLASLLSEMELPAGSRSRYTCIIPLEEVAGNGVESFGIRFQFRPEGEDNWRFCSEAQLGFAGGPVAPEAEESQALKLGDVVLTRPGELLSNEPVDPLTLLQDIRWDLPGDAADFAVTLRAPLDEAQQADFASAGVKLVMKKPKAAEGEYGLQYVAELYAPVTLSDGALACDFSGLLVRVGDKKRPPVQHISSQSDGTLRYDLRSLILYTDNTDFLNNDSMFETLYVTLDPAKQEAWVSEAALERPILASEVVRLVEYWSILYDYEDGEGSPLTSSSSFAGESCDMPEGTMPLCVCPAENYDLLVVFTVKNKDGSAYTIAVPYAEACGQVE